MRYLIFSALTMLLFAASAQAQTTKFKVVDGGASLSDKDIDQPGPIAALHVCAMVVLRPFPPHAAYGLLPLPHLSATACCRKTGRSLSRSWDLAFSW